VRNAAEPKVLQFGKTHSLSLSLSLTHTHTHTLTQRRNSRSSLVGSEEEAAVEEPCAPKGVPFFPYRYMCQKLDDGTKLPCRMVEDGRGFQDSCI
jgi:hypothetical protein